jgi:hypothetical protein
LRIEIRGNQPFLCRLERDAAAGDGRAEQGRESRDTFDQLCSEQDRHDPGAKNGDANFRTLPKRESKGVAGEFMGGYCAIRFGMRRPDVFGSVYGLHPVGTGSGLKVLDSLPNWDLMANAKSLEDVRKDGYSDIFTTIFQASAK